jgi:3-isopropylmalate/(R)-2-methylmalate dehydratase small subunit
MPEPFTTLTGTAIPLLLDDVNTDQIAPATKEARGLHPDYRKMLFARWCEEPGFVLNRPQFRDAKILVARNNFGCGSSRESAVWSLVANGIRAVVARSIADIYRDNCIKNGVLPVALDEPEAVAFEALVVEADGKVPFTVDLHAQRIAAPGGRIFTFEIAPAERTALLEGLDDIGLTLKHLDEIVAWEARMKKERPWLQTA